MSDPIIPGTMSQQDAHLLGATTACQSPAIPHVIGGETAVGGCMVLMVAIGGAIAGLSAGLVLGVLGWIRG